jgi:signal transduction histidine kinase
LISLALLISNLADGYFGYEESVRNLANIQREMAKVASAQVRQYLADLDQQLDVLSEEVPGQDPLQHQLQDLRRLRRVPAFTELVLLDHLGRERLHISRTDSDHVDTLADYSTKLEFKEAKRLGYFRSRAYFVNESEPHINIAIASKSDVGGVVIASISLEMLLRSVTDTTIGSSGYAYAVDSEGMLIAHRDLNLVLKGTRFTDLPQVQYGIRSLGNPDMEQDTHFGLSVTGQRVLTAHSAIPELNWLLFVEQPAIDALFPLIRATVIHTLIMLIIGLAIALTVTTIMVRRLITPIRALKESANQIAQGSLSYRIELNTRDELQDLADQFNTMAQNLSAMQDELVQSEKFAALGSMVAGVAHELNTPLGNALLSASTVIDVADSAAKSVATGQVTRTQLANQLSQLKEGTELILVSLRRAASLIASFKQVAVDQSSDRKREFDLATVVLEVVDTLRPRLKSSVAKLDVEIPSGITVNGYPGPLGQIVMNLVNNAVIHAFEGRTSGQITLQAKFMDEETIRLEVVDNGNGIPLENLGRIFDPFFTTKLGRGGSGLGLSICYRLAHNVLGGQLQVNSTVGSGTTFLLTFPLAAPQ